MSVQDYTLPELAERYEYIVFEPDAAIQQGNRGFPQPNRNDITFTINDRTSIYDYANGYFDVVFYIERLVGVGGGVQILILYLQITLFLLMGFIPSLNVSFYMDKMGRLSMILPVSIKHYMLRNF